ncbi:hypothetical protein P153DRAFT_431040 [Dothidotthia symphoricarpi CBS 119687]|uniref:Uncharacterized protein n=1 Tax=Dothidotthia symphoricarpi CBS 119687 TaxID=1392245 RepID=A0A6A6ADV5_9PLEO|nr:uncharacterized protein P153DRAFT_431040 [Dothidotthia symphoricarpi CBS 119687]KAF2129960.1 hypothetical protein P153DRAFT_431040 [Dothidotthia symphoricarpi CBS 119687]
MTGNELLTLWQQTPSCCEDERDSLQRLTSPLADSEAENEPQPQTLPTSYRDQHPITRNSRRPTSPRAVSKTREFSQQTSDLTHFYTQHSSQRPTSERSREPQSGFHSLQQLTDSDLFYNLLHNRQQVYRNTTRLSTEQPTQQRKQSTTHSLNALMKNPHQTSALIHDHFQPAELLDPNKMVRKPVTRAASAKKKGTPSKTPPKTTKKADDSKTRKRRAESTKSPRPSKKTKTEEKPAQAANTKKKVLIVKLGTTRRKPIVLDDSDEDEDDVPLTVRYRTRSLLLMAKDESATPAPNFDATIYPSIEGLPEMETLDYKPDIQSHLSTNDSKVDSALADAEKRYELELKQLRQELEAAQAKIEQMEKSNADVQLQRERDDQIARQELDDREKEHTRLSDEFEAEKTKFSTATKERDALQLEVDQLRIERSQAQAIHLQFEVERKQYQQERNELQNNFNQHQQERVRLQNELNQLRTELETARTESSQHTQLKQDHFALQRDLEQEKEGHANLLLTISKQQPTHPDSAQDSQDSHTPLRKDSESFSQPPPSRLPFSPAPSSASTTDEKKTENIRTTFIKVNRKYSALRSVAAKLTTCTRTMDLSSFGEFGKYCRQLGMVLKDDEVDRGVDGGG